MNTNAEQKKNTNFIFGSLSDGMCHKIEEQVEPYMDFIANLMLEEKEKEKENKDHQIYFQEGHPHLVHSLCYFYGLLARQCNLTITCSLMHSICVTICCVFEKDPKFNAYFAYSYWYTQKVIRDIPKEKMDTIPVIELFQKLLHK